MQDRARSSQIRQDHRTLTGWPLSRLLPIFLLRLKIVWIHPHLKGSISYPRFNCRTAEKVLYVLLQYTPCPPGVLANCILSWSGLFDIPDLVLIFFCQRSGGKTVKSKRVHSLHHLPHPCINPVGTTPTRPAASSPIFQFNHKT